MAVRVVCDFCRCVMNVSDELRGRKIKCKECGGVLAVADDRPAVDEGFADRRRLPPVANPSPRRRSAEARDDDDGDRRSPRRRRERASSGSTSALWIAGGTGAALLLVVVIVLVAVLAGRSDQVAVVQNDAPPGGAPIEQAQPAAVNPANPAAPQADVAPAPLPPLVDQPPAGAVLNGEQIYNRMLRSTVWIVAAHKIARREIENEEIDNGHRALQFPQPPFPQPPRPQIPQIPRPQIPRPFGPIGPRMPFGPQPFNPGLNPGGLNPGIPNPGIPNPGMPQMPQMPLPQNPADLLPNPNQQSTLTGTVWNGSETLPGYGKLTFQFVTNTVAIMIDARETMRGTYRQNGNSVTITFGGGVIYSGTINGDAMGGNAHNGRDNWNWNVAKSGGGNVPTNPGGPGIVAKSSGSGSLIDRKHRLIVTNVHVVGTSDTVQVYFPEFDDKGELIVHSDNYKRKPGLTGRVVAREPRADLAFVQLQRLPENSLPLPVATSKAKVASQVHSVGNPGASKGLWIYSPGKVRQVFQDNWKILDDIENRMCEYNAMKLETDSAINPGDSGGPLVNDRCTMVGVAHGHSLAANNISIFIEASEVRGLLERYYAKFGEKWAPEMPP